MANAIYINAIYMGKVFAGQTQPNKQGVINNKYTQTWKSSEQAQNTFKIYEFVPLANGVESQPSFQGIPNQWYNVAYYESTYPKFGKMVTSRIFSQANPGKGAETPRQQFQPQQQYQQAYQGVQMQQPSMPQNVQPAQVPQATADQAFQQAMVDYLNAMRAAVQKNPAELANLNVPTRMFGAVLNKAHPEAFAPLLQLCKQALENFKP